MHNHACFEFSYEKYSHVMNTRLVVNQIDSKPITFILYINGTAIIKNTFFFSNEEVVEFPFL